MSLVQRIVDQTRAQRLRRRGFLWLSAATQTEAGLSLLVTALVVRELGLSLAGEVFFAQAVAALFFMVVDPRLEDSLQRYVPRYDRQQPQQVRHLVRRLATADALTGLSLGGLAAGCVLLVDPGPTQRAFLLLAVAAGALGAVQGTAGACYAVTEGFDALGLRRLQLAMIGALTSLSGLWVAGATGFLVAQVILQLLVSGLLLTGGLRRVSSRWRGTDRARLPPGFTRYTALSSLSTSAALGSDHALIALSTALTSSATASGLRIAMAPGRLMFTAFSPLWSIMFPQISVQAAEGDVGGIRRAVARSAVVVAAVSAPTVVLATVLLPTALPIVFGPGTQDLALPAAVFVMVYAVRACVGWSKVAPLALGRPGVKLLMTMLEAVALLAVVAYLLSGPDLGMGSAVQRVALGSLVVAGVLAVAWGVVMAKVRPAELRR